MPAKPAGPAKFEFVIGNRPDQLKSDSSRKLRSYLSKRAWQAYFEAQAKTGEPVSSSSGSPSGSTSSGSIVDVPVHRSRQHVLKNGKAQHVKSTRRGKRGGLYSVTFEYAGDCHGASTKDGLALSGNQAQKRQEISGVKMDSDTTVRGRTIRDLEIQFLLNQMPQSLAMDTQLGGGRVDPFKSYPVPWQPYIPALADHYVVQMAVDIPELDQPGNKGLLRSRWFPLVVSDPSCFRVVMLLSAANYASINGIQDLGSQILQLKQEAISAINAAFIIDRKQVSDGLIGSVAKMASFEAVHGDVKSYKMHMAGLQRMVAMRGGLDSLGLGGLLRRIIVWIDLNSSFLLQIPRFYPGTTFTGMGTDVDDINLEPNPERYIAA